MKTLLTISLLTLSAMLAAPLATADTPKQDNAAKAPKEEKKKDKAKADKSDGAEKAAKDKKSSEDATKAPKPGKAKPYPLKTCIVTDNDLGAMGDTVTYVHEGQEVKFCCDPCKAKFLKDPAKYLEKLPKAS